MSQATPWKSFVEAEIHRISKTLESLDLFLSEEQPHTQGESFLTTKDKLVLFGSHKGKRVVIKASRLPGGQEEILREKQTLDLLQDIPFANDTLLLPLEVLFTREGDYLFWVSMFIPQETVFGSRSVEEQFFTILRAIESQEAFHATTFEHLELIKKSLSPRYARDYFESFASFRKTCTRLSPETDSLWQRAEDLLRNHKQLVDSYCNHLTHTDFVPSNFRLNGRNLHLIDLSSMAFGNKYEGLARLLNHALIHNLELLKLLEHYIGANRGPDELLDLRLMRIYKVGFLLDYYTRALSKTEGDLKELTRHRINFWLSVLEDLVVDRPTNQERIEDYKKLRDKLRSVDELERQKEFNRL